MIDFSNQKNKQISAYQQQINGRKRLQSLDRSFDQKSRKIHPLQSTYTSRIQSKSISKYQEDDYKVGKQINTQIDDEDIGNNNYMNLKQNLNLARDGLKLAKTRNCFLEKQIQTLEQMLDKQRNSQSFLNFPDNHVLVQTMRLKYKEMKIKVFETQQELVAIKKSVRFTQIQEIQTLVEKYQDECKRLKQYLQEFERLHVILLQNNQIKEENTLYIKLDEQIFNNLVLDNKTLYQSTVELQDSVAKYRDSNENLKKYNSIQAKQIVQLQKIQKDKNTNITNLNNKIEKLQARITQLQPFEKLQAKTNLYLNYESQLNKLNGKKVSISEKIAETQNLTKSSYSNKNQQGNQSMQTKPVIKDSENIKNKFRFLSNTCVQSPVNYSQDKHKLIFKILSKQEDELSLDFPFEALEFPSSSPLEQQQQELQHRKVSSEIRIMNSHQMMKSQLMKSTELDQPEVLNLKIRLNKVTFSDIQSLGRNLHYRLLSKKIEYENLPSYLINQDQDQISLQNLEEILLKEPFMCEQKQARTLSRYLIEDNGEDFISFQPQRFQRLAIVQSAFKSLIGSYQIFRNQDRNEVRDQLIILGNLKKQIIDNIKLNQLHNKKIHDGLCEISELENTLKQYEITLNSRQKLYLFLISYEITNLIDQIDYEKVLSYLEKANDTTFFNQQVK